MTIDINFYEWIIDAETGFRKVKFSFIDHIFIKEIDKFDLWQGEYKRCPHCARSLPKSSYFFKIRGNKGNSEQLLNKCKECSGNRFAWGDNQKNVFKTENKIYCHKCDIVFPESVVFFAKDKKSSSGYCRYCKMCSTYSTTYGISRNLNDYIVPKVDYKICTCCLNELPKTKEYFFGIISNLQNDDLETICKRCQGISYGVVKVNEVYRDIIGDGFRFCSSCNQVKKTDDFFFKNSTKCQRYTKCKTCQKIWMGIRNRSHLESEYSSQDWEIALNFWTDINENLFCAYCDELLKDPQMEHIIPYAKGGEYLPDNIIPACQSCNASKGKKDLFLFVKSRISQGKMKIESLYKILYFVRTVENRKVI